MNNRVKIEAPDANRRPLQNGMSLLEILVVIAVVGFVLIIVTPELLRMLQSYKASTAAFQLATDIRFARNASVKKQFKYQIQIRDENDSPNPNSYTIVSDDGARLVELDAGLIVDEGDTTTNSFTFTTRGGLPQGSGQITLETTFYPKIRYRITVTPAGGVEILQL